MFDAGPLSDAGELSSPSPLTPVTVLHSVGRQRALLMWLELTRNTAVPSAAAPPAWPNKVDGNTPALASKDAGFTWGNHCINHCTGNHCTRATQERTQILPIHHLPLFIFLLPPAERLQVTHFTGKVRCLGRRTEDGRSQSKLAFD